MRRAIYQPRKKLSGASLRLTAVAMSHVIQTSKAISITKVEPGRIWLQDA